jgi:hypothetical protein
MAGMGIPVFNHSGVLPPYVSTSPADPNGVSPYRTTVDDCVARFNTSNERRVILQGLLNYRHQLRQFGLVGFQWLDGSFLENIEQLQNRPPGDIDVVTFFYRPAVFTDDAAWATFVNQNLSVFHPAQAKTNFHCDGYFVELGSVPGAIVRETTYWFGLFSHQKVTGIWKGMVEIELPVNDVDAQARATLGI